MTARLFVTILAIVVAPLAARAADDEHPLKKAKIGDFATYNKTSTHGIIASGQVTRTSITYSVILNCDKENAVIPQASEKESLTGTLHKIDLSKPFDPPKSCQLG